MRVQSLFIWVEIKKEMLLVLYCEFEFSYNLYVLLLGRGLYSETGVS
jgi:hypothetical protein